jgi:hypothetical protein
MFNIHCGRRGEEEKGRRGDGELSPLLSLLLFPSFALW